MIREIIALEKQVVPLFKDRLQSSMESVVVMRFHATTRIAAVLVFLAFVAGLQAAEPVGRIRAGIIGCDAHALDWTRIVNSPKAMSPIADMQIVAAYPGGSPDIPESVDYLKKSVEPMRALGVEMVDSIEALLAKVDVVLLLSIDGRKHLEQARPVFAAKKRVFVDKPVGGSLVDAIRIYDLARQCDVPCFSSSALRFSPGTAAVQHDPKLGEIRGCDAFSPCAIEPHHPDLYWYGVHGVETLFTIMGPGCRSVTRVHAEKSDVVVGLWSDGRIGTFRGTREGPHTYGATAFGAKGNANNVGRFEGYEPLIAEIAKFFKTGKPPITSEQTLEIMAFMEAADESRRQGGASVTLDSVMAKAKAAVDKAKAAAASHSPLPLRRGLNHSPLPLGEGPGVRALATNRWSSP